MKQLSGKKRDILIALALALAVMLLTGVLLNCQHNWGDDFAAYLLEGTALAEGRFGEQVSLNYALHHRLDPRVDYGQEHVYVWGYPLLLAMVCSAAGYDRTDFSSVVYYKLPNLLFLGVFVFVFYLLMRKRFGMTVSMLLTVAFAACARITEYTNSILTEIVFTAMCFACFLTAEKLWEQRDVRPRILYGILLGFLFWYNYEVRLNGIVVLLCVLFGQLADRLVYRRKEKPAPEDLLSLIPYAVFLLLLVVSDKLILKAATSGASDLTKGSLQGFFRNVRIYYEAMHEWLHDVLFHGKGGGRAFSKVFVDVSIWAVLILFGIGTVRDGFKRQNLYLTVYMLGSFLGTCMLAHNQWIRYIVNLLPLFLMYAAFGVKACADLLQKAFRAEEGKKTRFRRTAVRILAVCLTLYAVLPLALKAVKNGGNWQAHGKYAYSRDAMEMYRFIQENVPGDSVIQCNQYRALLQNTGRLTIHTAGDTAVADYYLHIDECSDAAGFTTDEFEEILDCGTLVLYRRK